MNPPIGSWAGKRVWVIGASTGIGAASARLLHELGARVAWSARSLDKLQQHTAGLARAMVAPLDVTDHASVIGARDDIVAAWGVSTWCWWWRAATTKCAPTAST